MCEDFKNQVVLAALGQPLRLTHDSLKENYPLLRNECGAYVQSYTSPDATYMEVLLRLDYPFIYLLGEREKRGAMTAGHWADAVKGRDDYHLTIVSYLVDSRYRSLEFWYCLNKKEAECTTYQ